MMENSFPSFSNASSATSSGVSASLTTCSPTGPFGKFLMAVGVSVVPSVQTSTSTPVFSHSQATASVSLRM